MRYCGFHDDPEAVAGAPTALKVLEKLFETQEMYDTGDCRTVDERQQAWSKYKRVGSTHGSGKVGQVGHWQVSEQIEGGESGLRSQMPSI